MAKNYFKECKAIINAILESMSSKNEFDDSQYYTIDILDVDDDSAKVMVCDQYQYLAKEAGSWVVLPEEKSLKQIA
ncbi:hypothetical protein AAK899_01660 [Erysipelotrichaceae bacterium 51-3]|uniref:hypothetical protein n=1 Tax=Allobaculum sp. JKK-2023 TaxID=3108943 RepID=UPI002B058C6B|nr:hypothetical protein [Allobaculum sp. JKK-2023]